MTNLQGNRPAPTNTNDYENIPIQFYGRTDEADCARATNRVGSAK